MCIEILICIKALIIIRDIIKKTHIIDRYPALALLFIYNNEQTSGKIISWAPYTDKGEAMSIITLKIAIKSKKAFMSITLKKLLILYM